MLTCFQYSTLRLQALEIIRNELNSLDISLKCGYGDDTNVVVHEIDLSNPDAQGGKDFWESEAHTERMKSTLPPIEEILSKADIRAVYRNVIDGEKMRSLILTRLNQDKKCFDGVIWPITAKAMIVLSEGIQVHLSSLVSKYIVRKVYKLRTRASLVIESNGKQNRKEEIDMAKFPIDNQKAPSSTRLSRKSLPRRNQAIEQLEKTFQHISSSAQLRKERTSVAMACGPDVAHILMAEDSGLYTSVRENDIHEHSHSTLLSKEVTNSDILAGIEKSLGDDCKLTESNKLKAFANLYMKDRGPLNSKRTRRSRRKGKELT